MTEVKGKAAVTPPAHGKRTIYMRPEVWQAAVDAAAGEHMSVSAWLSRAALAYAAGAALIQTANRKPAKGDK